MGAIQKSKPPSKQAAQQDKEDNRLAQTVREREQGLPEVREGVRKESGPETKCWCLVHACVAKESILTSKQSRERK